MFAGIQPFHSPEAIERESFAIIDTETGPNRPFSGRAWTVARRLVHATADFDILDQLVLPEEALDRGIRALRSGAAIITDTEMARCGMTPRHLARFGITPQCLLSLPGTAERAASRNMTRSRAGMELAGKSLAGSIVTIGNAPTALLALIDLLREGGPAPALVVAMPVGFVNAAESKALMLEYCASHDQAPACIAIRGRKGGSTLTAATINALAVLAAQEEPA